MEFVIPFIQLNQRFRIVQDLSDFVNKTKGLTPNLFAGQFQLHLIT